VVLNVIVNAKKVKQRAAANAGKGQGERDDARPRREKRA
jgi:hypothetical protein